MQGFMSKDSRALLTQLKLLFDSIITFSKAQESLYTTAQREVQEEKKRQQTIEQRTLEVGSTKSSFKNALTRVRQLNGSRAVCAGIVGNFRE